VIFFICVWGIVAFLMDSTVCLTIWSVFAFLTSLFVAAVAIMTIIFAYYVRNHNQPGSMLACETRHGSILNMYNNVDQYLQQVDQGLCSQACPCGINNTQSANNWRSFYPNVYNTWTINPQSSVNSFGNCPSAVQSSAYNNAQRNYAMINNNPGNYNPSFRDNKFSGYWANIENKFQCTGFCNTTYINGNGQNITMVKYLFSDINRGIPATIGCKPAIFTWLSHFLDVWGALALTIATILFIVFLMALTYICCSRDAKYEREPIPVIPVPVPNQNRLTTENNPNVVLHNNNNNVVRPAGNVQELRQY